MATRSGSANLAGLNEDHAVAAVDSSTKELDESRVDPTEPTDGPTLAADRPSVFAVVLMALVTENSRWARIVEGDEPCGPEEPLLAKLHYQDPVELGSALVALGPDRSVVLDTGPLEGLNRLSHDIDGTLHPEAPEG